jgi:hypothetical protein
MWFKEYRDYPNDKPLIKEKVEPLRGIIGCEMHELNGFGTHLHHKRPHRKGLLAILLSYLFTESVVQESNYKEN